MKNIKTIKCLLILCCLLAAMCIFTLVVNAETIESGYCGKSKYWQDPNERQVSWRLDDSGVLTISGTGEMVDFYDISHFSSLDASGTWSNSPDRASRIKHIIIKDGVKTIGNHAFYNCINLESVAIPGTVISIGEGAFEGCSSLSSIVIPDSVLTINRFAFGYCKNLVNVTIPNSLNAISGYAFCDCVSLKEISIPNSVTAIGEKAFSNCTALVDIMIPNSVTVIYDGAFSNCENLASVVIPKSVTTIGGVANYRSGVFSYCKKLTSVTIPDSVTSIGEYTFYGCTNLTSVNLGNGLSSIGDYSFSFCSGLTEINAGAKNPVFDCKNNCLIKDHELLIGCKTSVIPSDGSVTKIGHSAFMGCTTLESILIPDCITDIGAQAFNHCTGLSFVMIPKGVTHIGDNAFAECTNLVSISIPDSVTIIEYSVFKECSNLKRIYYSGTEEQWGKIQNQSGKDPSHYDCLLENGIVFNNEKTSIQTVYDNKITEVTIPTSIISIDASAFYGCTEIEKLIVGNVIEKYTLADISMQKEKIKTVVITEGATTIKEFAFIDCPNLTDLMLPDSMTNIGDSTFCNCPMLTKVNIPKSVTRIGTAFNECKGIIEYIASEENQVFTSENGILYNKEKTEIVRYPSAKDEKTFIFPENVTALADYAFADNQHLTSLRIPDYINSLGKGCFARCNKLQTVVCGSGAVTLPVFIFVACRALTAVTIPYGVSGIGANAFLECDALTTITISNDMGVIGQSAFSGCNELNTVFYSGTANEWTAIGIKGGNDDLSGARKVFGAVLTPQMVTMVEVVKTGDRSVTLQWKPVKGATEYRIYGMTPKTQKYELLATVTQAPCEITGLTPETAYTLAVEAAAVTAEKTLTAGKSDPVMVTTEKQTQAPGDVDGDGKLTSADARLALRASVGLEPDITAGSDAYLAADADGDGKVSSADARLILRASVGLEDPKTFGKKA